MAGTATKLAIPRLPRRLRVALLTVHIVMSVGWVGLLGALVAMEVIALATVNPLERAGIATAMAAMTVWVLVPVVFASMTSGLVLALFTPWGLTRHWWVLAKCGIAVVVTVVALALLLPQLHQIIAGDGEPIRMLTLIARSAALLLLLVATGLSVVKPWGKTPRGRRTHGAGKRPVKTGRPPGKTTQEAGKPPRETPQRVSKLPGEATREVVKPRGKPPQRVSKLPEEATREVVKPRGKPPHEAGKPPEKRPSEQRPAQQK
jgi:hypothetical protein